MSREKADKLVLMAGRASMTVALTLVAIKAAAWWYSGSVSMFGSLADSSLDLMASLVTVFAVKKALKPADEDHRFGHGKAEALAGLFQSSVMLGSAVFIALESIGRIYQPQTVVATDLVTMVSVIAIVLTLMLVGFQSYVIKKSGSIAIAGDHLHYKGDLLMNIGVMVAVWLSWSGYQSADGVIGLLIGLYIAHSAVEIVRPAIDMLMDKEFEDEERENIFNIVMETQGVMGLHDLKTRRAGRDSFIQMHIEVDGGLTVREGHNIADEVEAILGESFAEAEILIHIDPPSVRSHELTSKEII